MTIDTYPISKGRTNCDFRSPGPYNAVVCTKMNVVNFWDTMLAVYMKIVPANEIILINP